ncbi:hypothetical protein ABKN59_003792 [Abortiporus biennis]
MDRFAVGSARSPENHNNFRAKTQRSRYRVPPLSTVQQMQSHNSPPCWPFLTGQRPPHGSHMSGNELVNTQGQRLHITTLAFLKTPRYRMTEGPASVSNPVQRRISPPNCLFATQPPSRYSIGAFPQRNGNPRYSYIILERISSH